jgi:ABC-type lipoprotein release transport system permease subunit
MYSLVIMQAAYLLLIGTVTNIALAWSSERAITAMSSTVGRVNSTGSSDPAILIGAPLLLSALALLACYLPARKSVDINPVVALREE